MKLFLYFKISLGIFLYFVKLTPVNISMGCYSAFSGGNTANDSFGIVGARIKRNCHDVRKSGVGGYNFAGVLGVGFHDECILAF
jgi:hypothetical protein